MMQSEFEEMLGEKVSASDYVIIDFVYTWHPTISNTRGKQQIVSLYKSGGMDLMKNLLSVAAMQAVAEENMTFETAKVQVKKLLEQYGG